MSGKKRILAVSDLHGDSVAAEHLAKQANKEKADVVVIAGDITNFDSGAEGTVGPFLSDYREVMLIPGNHDSNATVEFLSQKYGLTNLHGYSKRIGSVGIFGCGAANIGPNIMSDEETFAYLERGFRYVKDCNTKIMVTHVHPAGSRVEKSFRVPNSGSHAVRRAIEEFKPDVHICGHLHDFEGMVEKIDGTVSFCIGKRGKFIDVE